MRSCAVATVFLFLAIATAPGAEVVEVPCPACQGTVARQDPTSFLLTEPFSKSEDGFYYASYLTRCPSCGLLLPWDFYVEIMADGKQTPLARNLRNYVKSAEFASIKDEAPQLFVFCRVLEHMDPKALTDPLQRSFMGFWCAGAAWQAEGHETAGMRYPANPDYVKKSLEAAASHFEASYVLDGERAPEAVHPLYLQVLYMNADVRRKQGDFTAAAALLEKYASYSRVYARGNEDAMLDPRLTVDSMDRMAARLKQLVDAGDSDTRIFPAEYVEQ